MKNAQSRIRFIETFVIATFPLALAVGCSITGEQKPTDISMQEEVSIQQPESIKPDELNKLTFADLPVADSATDSSDQGLAATDSNANTEEPQSNSMIVNSEEPMDTDESIQTSNTPDESALTPVNLQTPEQSKIDEPDLTIVHFAVNKFDLNEQDIAMLQKHAEYLQQNPSMVINVNGYSDSRGSAKLNFELSRKRAQQVANVLIDAGARKASS